MLKKMFNNEYIYSVITRIFTLGLSLVQSVVLARFLGAAYQGTYSYIFSITSILSIIITFGMHQAYPYFRKKEGKEAIFDAYMSIITCFFIFYLLMSGVIACFINQLEVKTAVIITPILMYSNIVEYVSLIERPNQRNTLWTVIYALQVIYIFVLYLFCNSNFWLMCSIIVLPALIKIFVFAAILQFKFSIKKGYMHFAFELVKYGFFPMIALLLTTLNYKIDIMMLNQYDFISKSMVGVYSIGMDFADKISLIPDTLKGILVSRLAKGADEKEVAKVSRLCFWVSIAICLGMLLIGEPFIQFLYGEEYNGAYQVLVLCSFGSVFVGYFKLIAQYNIVNKKQIRNVVLLSGSIVVNVVLNLLLIPKYKLAGAAFASGMGYFLTGIIFVMWFSISNRIPIKDMFLFQKDDLGSLKRIIKRR